MLWSIISAIIVGAVVGVLGRLLVKGKQNMSVLATIAIGIVAAIVGTLIARVLGVVDTSGIDWIELVPSPKRAVIVLIQVVLAAVGVSLYAGRVGRIR